MIEFTTSQIIWTLVYATRWTVLLSGAVLLLGGLLGLFLLLVAMSKARLFQWISGMIIAFVQGTPLLIQLFLMFFGVAALGLQVSAWTAALLAMTLWAGAFLGEIWKGSVDAVNRGQWEASASLGMSSLQQLRYVISPQAIRIAIPSTVGFLVQVIKGTSLCSIVGIIELNSTASFVSNATYRPLLVYGIVGVIYFILCFPLSLAAHVLARRLNVAYRDS